MLRELDRVLRPGGWLHLSIPRSSSLQDRLYRFTLKGGGHLQRYNLESFVGMVYQETAFKLEGYASSHAGFNWLRDVPCGDFLQPLLFRSLRAWAEVGWRPLEASDYRLLFRLGERGGHRRIEFVCARCGGASLEAEGGVMWLCSLCGFENLRVDNLMTHDSQLSTFD